MVHDAPATFTEDAFAVTIVDHDHGIMLFGQGHDLVQRRDVTVHEKTPSVMMSFRSAPLLAISTSSNAPMSLCAYTHDWPW